MWCMFRRQLKYPELPELARLLGLEPLTIELIKNPRHPDHRVTVGEFWMPCAVHDPLQVL
jgi:hypothetical protein